jgi:hypothetical protein
MRRGALVAGLILGAALTASGQGIRKDFREMTEAEKLAYRDAVESLWNSDSTLDMVRVIRDWHREHGMHIHATEHFLPWHRMALWEMENAIQSRNAALTIPYWDWRVVRDTTDSLFQFFLALPVAQWDIERALGTSSTLPNAMEVACILSRTEFWDDPPDTGPCPDTVSLSLGISLANGLEDIHAAPHDWVGGHMGDIMTSPIDPIFYLHHAMVDKIWQEWEGESSFQMVELNRYDGYTENPIVGVLPEANADSIVDSRRMVFDDKRVGVFYTKGGLAKLDGGYKVDNAYQTPEQFIFPGIIEASDFEVPAGKSAVIQSNTGIKLKPGFVSKGNLVLKVGGYDDNFSSSLAKAASQQGPPAVPEPSPSLPGGILNVARISGGLQVTFRTEQAAMVQIRIHDAAGRTLGLSTSTNVLHAGEHVVQVPIRDHRGVLYLRLRTGNKVYGRVVTTP